jgi:(p)ppGpp synthase/HD superfamily hydrolase
MQTAELLEKAIAIAVEAHKGQLDRYGAPYILHVLKVMQAGYTQDEKIVGVLHDIIEDTHWTAKDLAGERFPEHIVAAIDSLSKKDSEEYEAFIDRIKKNTLAISVKLNDLRDNMDLCRVQKLSAEDIPRLNKYIKAYQELMEL